MSQEKQKVEDRALVEDVVIFGANLLHPKQLEIIQYALRDQPDNDLKAIFITDGPLNDHVGEYCRATRSAAISLHEIMADAMTNSLRETDAGLSLPASCWIGFIYVLFHELHHNIALSLAKKENLGDDWKKEEEELACEFAEEKIEPAIIECNADLPSKDEFPLMDRLLNFLVSELHENPESTWVGVHKERIDEGIVFINKDDIFDSLVEYFKAASDTPEKYERENEGAAMAIVQKEEMPSMFDKKVLPGEQPNLFPDNGATAVGAEGAVETEPVTVGGDLGNTLSAVQAQLNEENDIGDDLPAEAYNEPEPVVTESIPGVSTDPFAPNFTPVQPAPAKSAPVAQAIQQPIATGALEILRGLYMRMYNQMFTAGVTVPLNLTDAEKELGLVVGCVVSNGSGGWITGDVKQAGYIKGCLYKDGVLPAYDLWINWGGVARHVKMIAQNQEKKSTYAEQARNGAKIVWLLDAEKTGNEAFMAKIINGVYSSC